MLFVKVNYCFDLLLDIIIPNSFANLLINIVNLVNVISMYDNNRAFDYVSVYKKCQLSNLCALVQPCQLLKLAVMPETLSSS